MPCIVMAYTVMAYTIMAYDDTTQEFYVSQVHLCTHEHAHAHTHTRARTHRWAVRRLGSRTHATRACMHAHVRMCRGTASASTMQHYKRSKHTRAHAALTFGAAATRMAREKRRSFLHGLASLSALVCTHIHAYTHARMHAWTFDMLSGRTLHTHIRACVHACICTCTQRHAHMCTDTRACRYDWRPGEGVHVQRDQAGARKHLRARTHARTHARTCKRIHTQPELRGHFIYCGHEEQPCPIHQARRWHRPHYGRCSHTKGPTRHTRMYARTCTWVLVH